MKIIAVNAGSSSLKFQLLDMPAETLLASGVVERIGLNESIFTIKYNGERDKEITSIPTHSVAVEMLLEKLVSLNILTSLERNQMFPWISSLISWWIWNLVFLTDR